MLNEELFSEAQESMHRSLAIHPNHPRLLELANEVNRALGNRRKALEYSKKLIRCEPLNWDGYQRTAHDLMAFHDYQSARSTIRQGLERLPNHQKLLELESLVCKATRLYFENDILFALWHDLVYSPVVSVPHPQARTLCNTSIRVIQYWSQGAPPAQIQDITKSWNIILDALGLQPIHVWSKLEANAWIKQYAPQFVDAFQSAPHYASESDVFRLAYAASEGCIWLDSDIYPKNKTLEILRLALSIHSSVLNFASWTPYIESGFFIARNGCPFDVDPGN